MTASSVEPRHAGVVLLYHRVAAVSRDPHRLCVPPETFASHVRHISRTCHPLALDQLVEGALQGTLPPRSVAVTFDDGYQDTLAAVDGLGEAHVPATLFLTSAQLEDAGAYHYWWDLLEWAVMTPDVTPHELELRLPDGTRSVRLESPGDREHAHRALHRALLPLDVDAREEALAPIRSLFESRRPVLPTRISKRELLAVSRQRGVRIGAHTDAHLLLPAQTPERQRQQIASNRETLEGLLGQKVTSLAYPFGASSPETSTIAGELGVEIAVTTVAASVADTSQRLAIPRVDAAADTGMPFEQRLDSFFGAAVQR